MKLFCLYSITMYVFQEVYSLLSVFRVALEVAVVEEEVEVVSREEEEALEDVVDSRVVVAVVIWEVVL